MTLIRALLLLVEVLLALYRILLLALCRILLLTLGKFLLALGLVKLRLLRLPGLLSLSNALRLCGLLRLSLILLTGLAELLLTGLILPRLRGLTLKPARLLLVLRTLRLRIPILRSLTAKALLRLSTKILLGILRCKSLLLRAASRRLRL